MLHPTIKQFNETIEIMRKAYPFKDEDTYIVKTWDYITDANTDITLITKHEETGTEVRLSRKVDVEDGDD